MGLGNVKHVVLILSGKGGVGKSSVTLQLALSLTQLGHNVGILDIDLTGPSIPRLLNLEDKKVTQAPGGWLPVKVHDAIGNDNSCGVSDHSQPAEASTSGDHGATANGALNSTSTFVATLVQSRNPDRVRGSLHALSLAFLLPSRSSAVIWRGPKKTAMVRQFVSDALWPPNTDYLLIDTPPGTSDEHIAIVEELHKVAANAEIGSKPQLSGAVVVTTPQAISTSDVRKELNFCVKTQVPVLGVIENMAGYMCPCCGEITNVFSKGGGEVMARECAVPFLGSVPIDVGFGAMVEGEKIDVEGAAERELVERYRDCGLCKIFQSFAIGVVDDIEKMDGVVA